MTNTLHLFLKIPDKKPPFIGVAHVHSPMSAQEDYNIKEYRGHELTLLINKGPLALDILILRKGFNYILRYSEVTYKPQELQEWLKACKNCTEINFGRVAKYDFGYTVCRDSKENAPFFVPVKKIVAVNDKWGPIIEGANS